MDDELRQAEDLYQLVPSQENYQKLQQLRQQRCPHPETYCEESAGGNYEDSYGIYRLICRKCGLVLKTYTWPGWERPMEQDWCQDPESRDSLSDWFRNPAPVSGPPEPGLMTLEEYLDFKNPQHRHHPETAYDYNLEDLNYDYRWHQIGRARPSNEGNFRIQQRGSEDLYTIYYLPSLYSGDPETLVAILSQGIMQYQNPQFRHRLPEGYFDDRGPNPQYHKLSIQKYQRVKYLEEVLKSLDDIQQRNIANYPVILQRIIIDDEPFQIGSKQQPQLNQGETLVILNQTGSIVAQASNEWGATLITVAREYRGRGLGKILGKIWYQYNPTFESGGFTPGGEATARARWANRVQELLAQGFYSNLIRQGLLNHLRLKQILAGLPKQRRTIAKVKLKPPQQRLLVFIEKSDDHPIWGPTFIIYDQAFLEEEDEKYIYGFGFFRDAPRVGIFLYTIDYDRPFAKLTTYLALQIARNNREKIYVGEGYGDLLELKGLKHLRKRRNYVKLTRDVLDLELLSRYESMIRKPYDRYGEKYDRLLEMAHTK